MKPIEIVLVEDEKALLNAMASLLSGLGHTVQTAESTGEALEKIRGLDAGLVILDLALPVSTEDIPLIENGMRLFEDTQRFENKRFKTIIVTGEGKTKEAVACIKRGAEDFVIKPIDPDTFPVIVERAMEKLSLEVNQEFMERKLTELEEDYSPERHFPHIVGQSRAMKTVFKGILYGSEIDENILITGETGTGKRLVAEAVHSNSKRRDEKFVIVNCGGLAPGLFESELFGSERGAYTGAHRRREGKFEYAGAGTVFLDEVGEIPLHLQAKLLHAVERRRITRVGGNEEVHVRARIICATNKNLEEEVDRGNFRQDLLYRLRVFPIFVPPLRDREGDIMILAEHFLKEHSAKKQKPLIGFSPDAREQLNTHLWPGNVRELENVMIRAVISTGRKQQFLTGGDIETYGAGEQDRPGPAKADSRPGKLSEASVMEMIRKEESQKYVDALLAAGGNKAKAARLLGIPENTFRYRVMKWLGK